MFDRLFKKPPEPPAAPERPAGSEPRQVAADASRCVQCGICGFSCPVGIEVREYARRGQNVTDPRCIACSACIDNCPRGTLRWGPAILVRDDGALIVDPDGLE